MCSRRDCNFGEKNWQRDVGDDVAAEGASNSSTRSSSEATSHCRHAKGENGRMDFLSL